MQRTSSSAAVSHQPRLPPGFKFHPTDEELVVHYLQKQAASAPLPAAIIAEIDLYKYDPWELPSKASFGEQEWYFFSPRERKYPNGERPNRAATSGYWKATGTDKPILTGNGTQKIGVKKALVFYGGKPPKGIKTNWIMHEYRLVDSNSTTNKPPGINPTKKNSSRLDDWVLCRIFKKSNSSNMEENTSSSISRAADIGYEINQIPGPGRNWNLFSGAAGNGSAINTSANPTSISPVLAAPPAMFSTNNQWEAAAADDDDDKNTCFISLLNDQQQQQYPQTIFHQNPSLIVLNNYSTEEGDGIPNQSYQHPNSYFQ